MIHNIKMKPIKFCIIKIGSNVLTANDGNPDFARMKQLAAEIALLRSSGVKVILVSSGAVAFGRKEINLPEKINPVIKKQIWASTGQIELIKTYKSIFQKYSLQVAQILVTKEDFRDRKHFLNMKNCLLGLLDQGVIPIVNENDTVAITELMFTDNDELASLTAAMVDADTLILLTNVNGIYTGHPDDEGSEILRIVHHHDKNLSNFITASKSSFGRGGMLTKLNMASKAANLGIQVFIANGKTKKIISQIQNGTAKCTYFQPQKAKQSSKKWLAHGINYYKGAVKINEGARLALTQQKISSLLPVGIIEISGNFDKGDILRISDDTGRTIGLGRAEYSSKVAVEKVGLKNQKPLIHYNYLYIFGNE
ncbi:glutamate 5-kinase [Belliella buryatensis]|uniref:Glutamate 5-kinase n=1 Tax=Belliella buryatensis TaxID=1500549 RepID=A0A239CJY4_9BACT|nr:glutamate 5-kinase [Belliella buryatensis]SNS20495.1 glutamate 5-kinase [Belliella buryatensis]